MAEPRWLDEREARVWRAYVDLQRELMGVLATRLAQDSGLSGAEYEVLVPLSEVEGGVLRARELGLATGRGRSSLSHQVKRMEKRGLVVREECEEDARGSMVRLTDAGRAALVAAAPQHVESVRRYFFDQLPEEDVETLGKLLDRILAGVRGSGATGQVDCDEA
jgi:DNA-binding MarR family transcriptional regulator